MIDAKPVLTRSPVTVLLPAFMRGRQPITSFRLRDNLSLVSRDEAEELLLSMHENESLSRRDVENLRLWDLFLKVESDRLWDFDTAAQYGKAALVCRLWLRDLRFAIDLAGGGSSMENIRSLWGHRPVFIVPGDSRWSSTVEEFADIHGPGVWDYEQLWTRDVLARASKIVSSLFFQRYPVRLRHVLAQRWAMLRLGLQDVSTRYTLAVTALESLYVAPDERAYLWDSAIQQRVRFVLGDNEHTSAEVFAEINRLRNDVVHRGGRTVSGSRIEWTPERASSPDYLLVQSILWAIENADTATTVIDAGFQQLR